MPRLRIPRSQDRFKYASTTLTVRAIRLGLLAGALALMAEATACAGPTAPVAHGCQPGVNAGNGC
jgi:hypothetical protein